MNRSFADGVASALGWAYAGTGLRIAVQLCTGIVLARILGPYSFGLAATAWALVGVGSQLTDLGFSAALIQRPELTERDVRFAFTVQMSLGTAAAAGFAAMADGLARWMGDAALAPVIRCLSAALLAQALGQTAMALLRRNLDFKTAQVAQTAGVLAGSLLVALPLAASGRYAVLSVALGQLTQIVVTSALAYAAVRHAVRPVWQPEHRLMRFGLKAAATNLANWLIASLDSVAMTKAFGTGYTGYFNRAQNLATTPASLLVQVVQSVLFPAYARRAGDAEARRTAYLASVSATAAILLPAVTVLAILSPLVVAALYGPAWASSAALLPPLALAVPFQAAMALSGPLLWAQDRVGFELRVQAAALVLFLLLLVLAMRLAPVWIAWSVLAVSAVRALPMVLLAFAEAGATGRDAARILGGPAVLAALAGAGALAVSRAVAEGRYSAPERLVAVGAVVTLMLGATMAAFHRALLPGEVYGMVERFRGRSRPAVVAWGGAR